MKSRSAGLVLLALIYSVAHAGPVTDSPFAPLPSKAPVPKDNPMSAGKIQLGQQLYFDPRLSKSGTVSCQSCHDVTSSGGDNRAVSVGVAGKTGGRSSPTVWNSAFHSVQFWDGRALSLEEQAKGPITNPVEMAMDNHQMVMDRVAKIPGYVSQFQKVFGGKNPVTIDNLAKAIAAYERTLITPNAPFDRYLRGNKKAISAQAERGYKTVLEVGCTSCHNGVNFNGPHAPGSNEGFYQKFPTFTENEYVKKYELDKDLGRFEVTKLEDDKHFWRVPTWCNVALTAPYGHNGKVKTLEEMVRLMAKVQLGKTVTDEQVSDIVAFLNTLTGEFPRQMIPTLPPTPGMTLVTE